MNTFWHRLPRPIKALAPMEDVTDTVFRRLVASCSRPDVFFTEFTSTDGLCSIGREGVIHRLKFTPEERPLVAQIWGSKPENYYKSAQLLVELGFDGIDINMGCPVSKIVKNGSCSALIEQPALAKEIFLATREGAGALPVSIKTRIGFRKIQTEEWCSFLLALNPAALTVHGRTAKELSKVPAKWDEIAKVVALRNQMASPTIILGNGDIVSTLTMTERVAQTGVDGVMVGRGIFQNLFIFSPHADRQLAELSESDRVKLLLRHAELFVETWGDRRDFKILKRFFKIYIACFPGASELRVKLMEHGNTLGDVRKIMGDWLAPSASVQPVPSSLALSSESSAQRL